MDFYNYSELIKKYRMNLFLIMLSFVLLSVVMIIVLPKKYKSLSVISISVKYFQNPLVREFVTETYDHQEMKAQREALLIAAVSDLFVDELAVRYRLYEGSPRPGSRDWYFQRSLLRKRIEVLPLNPSTTQISFYSTDPKMSQEVVQALFNQIIDHLKNQRRKFLVNLRSSMKQRLDSLIASIDYSVNLNQAEADFVENPLLVAERGKLKNELKVKLKFYSKTHPVVKELESKLANIEVDLQKSGGIGASPKEEKTQTGSNDELMNSNSTNLLKAKNMVYEDLVRKFEYLNIAINSEDPESSSYLSVLQNPTYPISYVFPNKAFFLMWGTLMGFLLCCVYIAIAENRIESQTKKLNFGKQILTPKLDFKDTEINV
jgi:uncharacterized protein involved in exopolysaccharide biosynthesis